MPLVILLGDSTRRRYEPAVRRLLAAAVPSLVVWAPDENTDAGCAFLTERVAGAVESVGR